MSGGRTRAGAARTSDRAGRVGSADRAGAPGSADRPTAARSADRVEAAIARLVRRYRLPLESAGALLALVQLLAGDRHAPTAVRNPESAVEVHLADSLVALELEEVCRARTIADIGSGAGFPGLPLALALPDVGVTLVESNARRALFLERAVAAAGATGTTVINARAEEWPEGRGVCDLVLARALAPLAVVAEYAAPLLAMGGALVVWRGHRDLEAEREGARAAAELGLAVHEPRRVSPYAGAEHRYLHVMAKVGDTPARFPRRPGMAVKRPLGRGRADRG